MLRLSRRREVDDQETALCPDGGAARAKPLRHMLLRRSVPERQARHHCQQHTEAGSGSGVEGHRRVGAAQVEDHPSSLLHHCHPGDARPRLQAHQAAGTRTDCQKSHALLPRSWFISQYISVGSPNLYQSSE